MTQILFVCIHNSARSQMAEAFLNSLAGDRFRAQSAGIESGKLNPRVVSVMAECGLDISANRTKTVQAMLESGQQFDIVITVCDAASAERCPVFPGQMQRLAWTFADPSAMSGKDEEVLERTRAVRDEIRAAVVRFIDETSASGAIA